MRQARPLSAVLALCCLASGACAQITADTQSLTLTAPNERPLIVTTRVSQTQLEVRWSQQGRDLELSLLEHRTCQNTALIPARRQDRVTRRPDAMIYWEYGLAALALGLSVASFVRPEAFSTNRYNTDLGVYERDQKTGYRLGGVFAAIGTGFLIGGIVDSVRSRDQVRVHDTTLSQVSPALPCAPPTVPASQRPLEITVNTSRLQGSTDIEGKARFTLPPDLLAIDPSGRLPTSLHVGPDLLVLPLRAPGAQANTPSHTGSLRAPPH